MKHLIMIGCLIGSIYAVTGDSGHIAELKNPIEAANAPAGTEVVITALDLSNASLAPLAPLEEEAAVPADVQEAAPASTELQLLTVNKISLYDNQAGVIDKLGEPLSKEQDEHMPESEVYGYPDMNVYFRDGIVDFVEILESAEFVLIDEAKIPASEEDITKALGQPDYVTEDGIVFERNEYLLKLFIDSGTGRLTSITYFHAASM